MNNTYNLDPKRMITSHLEADSTEMEQFKTKAEKGRGLYLQIQPNNPKVIYDGDEYKIRRIVITEFKNKICYFYLDDGMKTHFHSRMMGTNMFIENNDVYLENGDRIDTYHSFYMYQNKVFTYQPNIPRPDLYDSLNCYIEVEGGQYILIILRYLGSKELYMPDCTIYIDENPDLGRAIYMSFVNVACSYSVLNSNHVKSIEKNCYKFIEGKSDESDIYPIQNNISSTSSVDIENVYDSEDCEYGW